MSKPAFVTVTYRNKCLDYPKDAPIPRKGEHILIEREDMGEVDRIHYHVNGGKLFMISIYCV